MDVMHLKARLTQRDIVKEGGEEDAQVFRYAEYEIYARNLNQALREYAAITLEKEGAIHELKLYVDHPISNRPLYSVTIHPPKREITVELGIPNTLLGALLHLCRKHGVEKVDIRNDHH